MSTSLLHLARYLPRNIHPTFNLIFLKVALITLFALSLMSVWGTVGTLVCRAVAIFTRLLQAAFSQRIVWLCQWWPWLCRGGGGRWGMMRRYGYNGDSLPVLITVDKTIMRWHDPDRGPIFSLYLLPCMFWWWYSIPHPWPSAVFLLVYYIQTLACIKILK